MTTGTYPLYKIVIGRTLLAAILATTLDWVGALLLIVLCIGAALLAGVDRLRKRPEVRAGLVKAAIYGVGAVAAFGLLDARRADDQATADRVVAALARYHGLHGAYPESLKQLAPALLAEIPRTRHSRLLYNRPAAGEYSLSYMDLPPGSYRVYESRTKGWKSWAD